MIHECQKVRRGPCVSLCRTSEEEPSNGDGGLYVDITSGLKLFPKFPILAEKMMTLVTRYADRYSGGIFISISRNVASLLEILMQIGGKVPRNS